MVLLALQQLEQARGNLRVVLQTTPREPQREFAETLAKVRDSRLVDVSELAQWLGISRSRLYDLLADADQE